MSEEKYTIKDFLEIRSSHSPTLNFDASLIVFINNNTGTNQLYLYEVSTEKISQLTDYPDFIAGAVFSPIENKIIFTKALGGNERSQIFLMDVITKETISLTTNDEIKYGFEGFSNSGKQILYSSNERNGTDFDIYIMNLETKISEMIFDGGSWCSGQGFSPNDSYVTVSRFDSNVNNDLFLIDLLTKKTTQLTNHKDETVYAKPHWLPNESGFYLRTNLDRDFMGLAFYDLKSNQFAYKLTPEWDVDELQISSDGQKLAYTINEAGYNQLHLISNSDFKEIISAPFDNGIATSLCFDKSGKTLAFDFTSSEKPFSVYLWDLEKNLTNRISNSECKIPEDVFIEPELIHFPSFDGLEISAFIYTPKGIENPPAVVTIHGGPEGQYQPFFASLTQFFLYNGYAVVAPNVRGSSGYGKKFLSLDNIEKRLDSVKDIEALMGYLTEKELVDPKKTAVMGGSYGGFMVLACLCFYPHLFAAGVDVVGIANFVSFLENTSPYRRALREIEYGYLDKDRKFLESISPINHIEKITAPLLVIHGANDPRVPLNEAQQVKDKLEALGRKVELLVYDDEGHGLGKLKNRLDAYPKVVTFLDQILKA